MTTVEFDGGFIKCEFIDSEPTPTGKISFVDGNGNRLIMTNGIMTSMVTEYNELSRIYREQKSKPIDDPFNKISRL